MKFYRCFVLVPMLFVSLAVAAADEYEELILADRPVAYWRGQDAVEQDAERVTANSARLVNPAVRATCRGGVEFVDGLPGTIGKAAKFNGRTAHLHVPMVKSLQLDTLSIEFWFKTTQKFDNTFWPGSASFVTIATSGDGTSDFTINPASTTSGEDQGRLLFCTGPADTGRDHYLWSPAGYRLNDGRWHHVVATRTRGGAKHLYIDGRLAASEPDEGGKISNDRPLQIGGEKEHPAGSYLDGAMDEIAIYPHVLSAERIAAHFAAVEKHLAPREVSFAKVQPKNARPARPTSPSSPAVPILSDEQQQAFFEAKIRPALIDNCYPCHSAKAALNKKNKGGFQLDTRAGIRRGGDTGPAVVPGDVKSSLLIAAIRHDDLKMPPRRKLPRAVVDDFVKWVEMGAPDPRDGDGSGAPVTGVSSKIDVEAGRKFWSFQSLATPQPSQVKNETWVRTPIDRFVLAEQEKRGLQPGTVAERYKLVRRAYFDLLGLPPAPAEVKAFVADDSPKAYEKLIDLLLESPHYGERWARHWLDLARFGESNGFEMDEDRPAAYHYRDFVIKALNQDMAYDQFVRWQIAGDLLKPDDSMARTATGYLVAGVENIIQSKKEFERDRYDKLDDMVSTLGTGLLGLTVGCARCHDHEYDPISQRDYYRLVASFGRTISREIQIDGQRVYAAIDVRGDSLSGRFALKSDVYFLSRGDVAAKQDVVTQSFPQVLMRGGHHADRWQSDSSDKTLAPRAAVAHWITDVENGAGHLLARVIVNRLWQHHLGTGLVATPSDFGNRGQPPSHPELLDWLAGELIRNEWRLKPIHRLIMTSSVYMQTQSENADNRRLDPANRFLWRRSLQRLDAETIRDTMLSVAGKLDTKLFGRGTLDENVARRSIYFTVKRSKLIAMLQLFDAPDAIQSIGDRQTTTVPPQSLLLMNSGRVRNWSISLRQRIERVGKKDLDEAIREGYLIALSRQPTDEQLARMRTFINEQSADYQSGHSKDEARSLAMDDFCHSLMCMNEFFYIE
ncbi:MAG: hypothetical protein ACI9HK_000548 [Pirellulaceae bacterium]|jgi:hypothetical protein